MKSVLLFLLASLLVFPPAGLVFAQQKPVAALGRVATLGEISEGQKKIITTRLESLLSETYALISQEQYRKAEEAAFASLDLEKCTEEECIRKIQELLQVDRLFILQIVKEADFTQLSLNLLRADSKRVVEEICEKCTIIQLYEQIDGLAKKLIGEDIKASAQELIAAQPVGAAPVALEEDEGISVWWWIAGGVLLAGIAAAAGSSSSEAAPTGSVGMSW